MDHECVFIAVTWCKVTIEGRLLHHVVPGSTPLYVSRQSSAVTSSHGEVTVMTRVEDVVLQHYASVGYTEG